LKVVKKALLLYAVTDRSWLGASSLAAQVDEALEAGVTLLQLREKELPQADFLAEAKMIKEITDRHQVPLIINDNIEVALACDAAGVHVGQSDLEAAVVRSIVGPKKIIGVSVKTVTEAVLAERQGADYLGVGAVFSTSTKLDADQVSLETLKSICASVTIPVVAIGGIAESNLLQLKGSRIAGVAVVSAIFAQNNIAAAVHRLRQLAQKLVNE